VCRFSRFAVGGYALLLALAVTAPLLAPGYLLLRDAVSTPRSYLTDGALGLSDAAPRAVPQDVAIALASVVLDGGVVVKVLLVAGLWLAGWGAARLVSVVLPQAGRPGEFVAATVAIWNPYVAERLLQGHWSLLLGYGALPWVAAAMVRLRTVGSGWRVLMFWVALAGLTPTGLLFAAIIAVVLVAVPGAGRSRPVCAATALGFSALAASPWLTASMLAGSLSAYRSAGAPGIPAFAARAEPWLGTWGSLAGLGGIWNSEAVPASRTTPFAVIATVLFLVVVLTGVWVVRGNRPAVILLVVAVGAVAVPAVLASGPGLTLLQHVVEAFPGLGVLRDGQKWVALAMPGYAVAAAGAVLAVPRVRPAVIAVVAAAAVIAVLPDLAWGVGGGLRPVHYPAGWAAAASVINADPRPVAVLPADSMRQFAWAGAAPVLDPLPRWVRAEVYSTGDLNISGQTVPGEGGRARVVQDLLLAGADRAQLADAGVGWLVVERSPGELGHSARTLATLPVAYRDADITVYRVGGDAARATAGHRMIAFAMHGIWLAMLVIGASALLPSRRRG